MMADNFFTQFDPAPAAAVPPQNFFAQFDPHPHSAAAQPALANRATFPFDQPGTTYGTVLPFAKNEQTGDISLAVPEAIRAPVRGIITGGERLMGLHPEEYGKPATPDETTAVMALGGLRSPAGKMPEASAAVRPPAIEARKAGYVLPPASISKKPGLVSNVLAGWSGKIKTQQAASTKNQEVTNGLASESLGLPRDTVLTEQVFNEVRANAGHAYQAVAAAVPVIRADTLFVRGVDELSGANSQAAKIFPKITNNQGITDLADELRSVQEFPTDAGLELVKELRFNANANLKAIGDPSKHALGLAQREAAGLVDELMDRNISFSGQPGVVDAYRQARQLIAKSYDVEGATNNATGDVSARGLAKLADKGRPLSGGLKTIADAAAAFPKAMQAPSGFGDSEAWSGLDFFGSAAAMAHGNPGIAAAILGRPAARALLLSRPYQGMITKPGIPYSLPFMTNAGMMTIAPPQEQGQP